MRPGPARRRGLPHLDRLYPTAHRRIAALCRKRRRESYLGLLRQPPGPLQGQLLDGDLAYLSGAKSDPFSIVFSGGHSWAQLKRACLFLSESGLVSGGAGWQMDSCHRRLGELSAGDSGHRPLGHPGCGRSRGAAGADRRRCRTGRAHRLLHPRHQQQHRRAAAWSYGQDLDLRLRHLYRSALCRRPQRSRTGQRPGGGWRRHKPSHQLAQHMGCELLLCELYLQQRRAGLYQPDRCRAIYPSVHAQVWHQRLCRPGMDRDRLQQRHSVGDRVRRRRGKLIPESSPMRRSSTRAAATVATA